MTKLTTGQDHNAPKRTWTTPRIATSEVFTKAALSCCSNEFNQSIGSAGVALPPC